MCRRPPYTECASPDPSNTCDLIGLCHYRSEVHIPLRRHQVLSRAGCCDPAISKRAQRAVTRGAVRGVRFGIPHTSRAHGARQASYEKREALMRAQSGTTASTRSCPDGRPVRPSGRNGQTSSRVASEHFLERSKAIVRVERVQLDTANLNGELLRHPVLEQDCVERHFVIRRQIAQAEMAAARQGRVFLDSAVVRRPRECGKAKLTPPLEKRFAVVGSGE